MADQEKDKQPFPDEDGDQKNGDYGGGEQKPSEKDAGDLTAQDHGLRKLSADVAQRREGHMFPLLALQLGQKVKELDHPFKSNKLPLEDLLFSLLLKTYFIFSSRRVDSWTGEAQEKKQIAEQPAPNTLLWYLRRPELTSMLQTLIGISSLPFLHYDKGFAVDSTRLYTEVYLTEDEGPGQEGHKKRLKLIRLHICCGVSSQIVTAARATAWPVSEKKYFEPLLRSTVALGFDVKAVMGDKNYISKRNLEVIHELMATPYITFKKNNVKSKNGSNPQWDAALESFRAREGEDLAAYRERNIIETVNSVIKKKFGHSVRGINETAQFNEALCKVICYNLCRLNRYDLNLSDRPSAEQWDEFIRRVIYKS